MSNDEGMPNDQVCDAAELEFWFGSSNIVREEPSGSQKYDLEERTARFGEALIDFAKTIPQNPVTNRLISQLVGAGTSIGANYCEADDAVSRKEFFLRIGTCRKEARETKHFLRMIVRAIPSLKPAARELWREARELHLIFAKICRSR
jgi:four helix bundle protein